MVVTVKGKQLVLRGAWHPEVPQGGSWLLLLLGILLAGGLRGGGERLCFSRMSSWGSR